jgi:hypothetical protein
VGIGDLVEPGQRDHFVKGLHRRARASEKNVLAQRAAKQAQILRDKANVVTKIDRVNLPDVDAVDLHLPLGRQVQAGDHS